MTGTGGARGCCPASGNWGRRSDPARLPRAMTLRGSERRTFGVPGHLQARRDRRNVETGVRAWRDRLTLL
jgi:hypothetical protein